mmetsp:Transcript_48118/g.71723  ORF Transcript_48118/g.71723 Transcript_48118/m.71723 type:complete len:106 (+) Transcript_48118:688-1005(+)
MDTIGGPTRLVHRGWGCYTTVEDTRYHDRTEGTKQKQHHDEEEEGNIRASTSKKNKIKSDKPGPCPRMKMTTTTDAACCTVEGPLPMLPYSWRNDPPAPPPRRTP